MLKNGCFGELNCIWLLEFSYFGVLIVMEWILNIDIVVRYLLWKCICVVGECRVYMLSFVLWRRR